MGRASPSQVMGRREHRVEPVRADERRQVVHRRVAGGA